MNTNTQISSLTLQDRYLIASVEPKKLAFPTYLVQDILQVERSQVLSLPFYDSAFVGVVHYQNQIIPLVSAPKILGIKENNLLQLTLTAVRLNKLAEHLTGVGIVIERMEGSLNTEELSQEHKFQLTDIPHQIWQPQR
ncbi:MAG: chemotaxis protein CheW [Xenococcaceae cyanobacterium MO_167.B27]|nr:chemotaxis protein CheW [Xenococcaceae cyanobacterium MO_167.B27]